MKLLYGDSAARAVSERVAAAVLTLTALAAIPFSRAVDGMVCHVLADDSLWQFDVSSALVADNILVVEPADGGAGAWLRLPGACELKLPFTFATADAAALLTLQAGQLLRIHDFFWQISADMTGGAASAIGASSNKTEVTSFVGKGDLLGGATGDVAATLTATLGSVYAPGTIGTDWDTIAKRRCLWKPTDTIRFDRITSAFTAGAGNIIVVADLLRNPGA